MGLGRTVYAFEAGGNSRQGDVFPDELGYIELPGPRFWIEGRSHRYPIWMITLHEGFVYDTSYW